MKSQMSKYSMKDHSFVICAYKESPYLEECLASLLAQSKKSNIILVTSTPCEYIEKIAEKYNLSYFINTGEKGIAEDWNFGISKVTTPLVTIAHQDDIYEPKYAEKMVEAVNRHDKTLIAFSDYGELRNGVKVDKNRLLKIKRFLLRGLRNPAKQSRESRKKGVLKLGSAICCPAVTINLDCVNKPVFKHQFRSNVDWQAWYNMTECDGAFSFYNEILMYHRIHEDSETSNIIADNKRGQEDYEMFCMFWPKWIAKIISRVYKQGEKSNNV